jgi:hypothetical protein
MQSTFDANHKTLSFIKLAFFLAYTRFLDTASSLDEVVI